MVICKAGRLGTSCAADEIRSRAAAHASSRAHAAPESETFLALLEPNLDALFSLGMRLARSRGEAEELVQEATAKAFARFSSFEQGTNFKAWIMKILVNAFLSGRRAAKRAPIALDEEVHGASKGDEDGSGEDDGKSPAWPGASDQVDEEIKHAVDSLPEAFREPFILGALGGMAYAEIAEILDVPVGTVMSRIHRARARLRADLKTWARERGWLGRAARFLGAPAA